MSNQTTFKTHQSLITPDETDIQNFAGQLKGQLIRPQDGNYDEARAVWNGMIDRYPALIARCAHVDDVVAAVNFARQHNLVIAVRGGGHNVAGTAVWDDSLVIDLSGMKQVTVDPTNKLARAEGGATWGDVDQATQQYGLAAPGGVVSETGIAGLTLGGGMGWLRRKYGLSCDNLKSVQMVTADGQIITASKDENADLFWGICGGGGNFGIVTAFEYHLHEVGPEVMFCFVFQPADNAHDALRFYRQYTESSPDEVSSFAILGTVPPTEHFPQAAHGKPFVLFAGLYAGPVEEGQRVLQPLRDYATPIVDMSGVMPYAEAQTVFDEDYPSGEMRYYWKSVYIRALDDAVIDKLIALQAEDPSPFSTIDVWQLGGAMSRIGPEETAFGSRSAPFLIGIESNWIHPEHDAGNIAWNRKVYRELQPFSDGNEYLNFPGLYEDAEQMVKTTFGANYQRLVALKNKYDPTNLFRINQNIKPTT
ncbi:MAG: FAD-linked oxidase [Anaerolineaceae bacterium]|nr:FAD-linked oxidase [Anaerolineaceae bacterium]